MGSDAPHLTHVHNEHLIASAIERVSQALNAARNGNQAGEDAIVAMAEGPGLLKAMTKAAWRCRHAAWVMRQKVEPLHLAPSMDEAADDAEAAIARAEGRPSEASGG
jgi:tRNA A37 threonylcarbamoyltransferase TsaD